MKQGLAEVFFILFISLLIFSCNNFIQKESAMYELKDSLSTSVDSLLFDSVLAKKYGADTYGMRPYVMAFLKAGPNSPKDSLQAVELQKAHMVNIKRLAESGRLLLAGPFYGDSIGDLRGIYIFNTSSIDSARAMTESDPAIKYGSLKMELINWYGSCCLNGSFRNP